MINFNKNLKKDVGARFRQFRKHLKLKQQEMADILDMNQTTITGIEKGKSFPTIPVLIFLMENYHLSLLWMFTGKGYMLSSDGFNRKDYGESTERMQDFIYHVENVDMIRYAMLSYFIGYKEENSEIIDGLLKKKCEKRK